jgi:hypothetical protein
MTPMLTKDHLIYTKTAMRHFSKALVYDSGNKQRLLRARAGYMHALEGARQKTRMLKVYMGGRQVRIDCPSTLRDWESLYYWETEKINCTPGVLPLFLAADCLAKPWKLPPTENFLQLFRILLLIIERGLSIWVAHWKYDWMAGIEEAWFNSWRLCNRVQPGMVSVSDQGHQYWALQIQQLSNISNITKTRQSVS